MAWSVCRPSPQHERSIVCLILLQWCALAVDAVKSQEIGVPQRRHGRTCSTATEQSLDCKSFTLCCRKLTRCSQWPDRTAAQATRAPQRRRGRACSMATRRTTSLGHCPPTRESRRLQAGLWPYPRARAVAACLQVPPKTCGANSKHKEALLHKQQ